LQELVDPNKQKSKRGRFSKGGLHPRAPIQPALVPQGQHTTQLAKREAKRRKKQQTKPRAKARSSPASPGSPSSASSASSPASPSLAEAAGLVQARSKAPPKRNLELQPVVPGRKGSSKRCKSGE
jgi:hypothetical protein